MSPSACNSRLRRHCLSAGSLGLGVIVRFGNFLAGAAALALASSAAFAEQGNVASDAAAFGARQAATNMDLSPDGNRIVYIGPGPGRMSVVFVGDLSTGTVKPIIKS